MGTHPEHPLHDLRPGDPEPGAAAGAPGPEHAVLARLALAHRVALPFGVAACLKSGSTRPTRSAAAAVSEGPGVVSRIAPAPQLFSGSALRGGATPTKLSALRQKEHLR